VVRADLRLGHREQAVVTELHRNAVTIQTRARELGLEIEPRELDSSARTAAEAAASLRATVGQIVKSLVFFRGEEPVIAALPDAELVAM
jgi:prolyl-tRNA editing enzyme YbaK/EbsC (Cys-tRNA(Pro) deacylase)